MPKKRQRDTIQKSIHIKPELAKAIEAKARELEATESAIYRAVIVAGFERLFKGRPL